MPDRSGKTGKLTIGLWFDEDEHRRHAGGMPRSGMATSTSASPITACRRSASTRRKRGHPHLFNKLAKVLRAQGKPHPAVVEE